ncbi:MAG: ABC transporter permease subunit [Jiangellaceae bacterium]
MTADRREPATTGVGFDRLLLAEWTKLRSVPRWMLGLGAMIALTLLLSLFTAAGSGSDLNSHPEELGAVGPDGQRVKDEMHFVHQTLAGDGSIVARVRRQDDSHEWAGAGVMVKESTEAGSPYAAIMVTPGHGVRLQSNFTTEVSGSAETAPRWLKLTRVGATITGLESADGSTWNEVGSVEIGDLPRSAEVGLLVNSPGQVEVERQFGSTSSGERATLGTATFDNVEVDATGSGPQPSQRWRDHDTSVGFVDIEPAREVDGVFTLSGSGELAVNPPDADVAQLSLIGINFGQIAAVAVGALLITAEYKRGMIRTTFAANPRRGRVLAAKAVVIGATTFVVGLVASLTAFFLTQPVLRSNGFGPPAYPVPSLTDGPVLRAVIGAALNLALVAIFALALGTIMRRNAGAIATGMVVLLLPIVFAGSLPLSVEQWLIRTTPAAGLSVLQTIEQDNDTAVEPWNMADPWVGLGVLGAYAAAGLAVACWQLRRRDA